MNYKELGLTNLHVSEICLGSMQFGWTADEQLSFKILDSAWEAGINFIDTADIYSNWAKGNPGGVSEKIIGKWMKESEVSRDSIVIATKVRGQMGNDPSNQGLSRHHIHNSVENSLTRLGTDYIDLYQAHWFDEETPIDETLSAFDELIQQGKVRYIGASNFPTWRLMQSLWASDKLNLARFDSFQPHYNLVHRSEFERETAQVCLHYGIGVIPYSPLAGGFLTGKYKESGSLPNSARARNTKDRYFNQFGWGVLKTVDNISRQRGKTCSQVALAWLLSNSLVTSPIVGPRTVDQLNDNLGASCLHLNEEEIEMLDQISKY